MCIRDRTIAGDGEWTSYDGNGINSGISYPRGIATDGANLYVAETGGYKIRRIDLSTGEVTTLAGSGTYSSSDGHGTEAGFRSPSGITIEGSDMYVVDSDGYAIRKISSRTTATAGLSLHNLDDDTDVTVALSSSDEGEATVSPATLTFTEDNWDTAQAVTVTGLDDNDTDGNRAYEVGLSAENVLTSVPEVTTFAGGSYGYQDGSGTEAYFSYPQAVTSDGTSIYVADSDNHRIRRIDISTGEVTTFAGSGDADFYDSNGINARFYYPAGITTDLSLIHI